MKVRGWMVACAMVLGGWLIAGVLGGCRSDRAPADEWVPPTPTCFRWLDRPELGLRSLTETSCADKGCADEGCGCYVGTLQMCSGILIAPDGTRAPFDGPCVERLDPPDISADLP